MVNLVMILLQMIMNIISLIEYLRHVIRDFLGQVIQELLVGYHELLTGSSQIFALIKHSSKEVIE